MAELLTTRKDLDAAMLRAQQEPAGGPHVVKFEYRPGKGLDLFILKLSDGHRLLIPREEVEGFEKATARQIANVEILGHGTGLHWPDLDLDYYVPGLLLGIYGIRQWMAQAGRRGGLKTSVRKRTSSRANGRKGGRPRQATLTA